MRCLTTRQKKAKILELQERLADLMARVAKGQKRNYELEKRQMSDQLQLDTIWQYEVDLWTSVELNKIVTKELQPDSLKHHAYLKHMMKAHNGFRWTGDE